MNKIYPQACIQAFAELPFYREGVDFNLCPQGCMKAFEELPFCRWNTTMLKYGKPMHTPSLRTVKAIST